MSLAAIKLAFILNGAAAISLLALIANLASSSADKIGDLPLHIMDFGCGSLCAAGSAFFTFFAGLFFDPETGAINWLGLLLAIFAVRTLIVSLVVFMVGLYGVMVELLKLSYSS